MTTVAEMAASNAASEILEEIANKNIRKGGTFSYQEFDDFTTGEFWGLIHRMTRKGLIVRAGMNKGYTVFRATTALTPHSLTRHFPNNLSKVAA